MNGRRGFRPYNADVEHQRLAGAASFAAFSARWRARQGLPLLDPMDVQYLTPQDFRNGLGQPLPPAEQRRRFRAYVEAAIQSSLAVRSRFDGRRSSVPASADIAYLRAEGLVRAFSLRPDFVYGGREDVPSYEALRPTRPYGIPLASTTFPAYWQAMGLDNEDEHGDASWMDANGFPATCENSVSEDESSW